MLELDATGGPATKVTLPSDFITGLVIRRVLISALVDERAHIETPPASLIEQAS
jgi:hypothetical protein